MRANYLGVGLPAFVGSIGLLRRMVDEEEEWLAEWDEFTSVYRFPLARRIEGTSYRSCLEPAVAESFGLDSRRDFIVSGLPKAHYQAPVEWAVDAPPQWVLVEFFPVELYGRSAVDKLARARTLRWLSGAELVAGSTADGAALDPYQCELIRRADVVAARHREAGK
ncbi:MAG: hypothetical protein R3B90_08165 [Planctomycetaceae bacterium]